MYPYVQFGGKTGGFTIREAVGQNLEDFPVFEAEKLIDLYVIFDGKTKVCAVGAKF